MAPSPGPFCRSQSFYLKDPEDPYKISEFDLLEGRVQFRPGEDESAKPPALTDESETYCGLCS